MGGLKKFGTGIGGHSRRASADMGLNITAMADIFTIILVFLLKSYASGAVSLSTTAGLVLPDAQAEASDVSALKVEVSEKAVLVEGAPVSPLEGFRPANEDRGGNGTIRTLVTALERERKRQLLIAQSNTSVKVDPRVIVLADKRAPYATLKAVLASAAVQGYTDFKLAVVKGK